MRLHRPTPFQRPLPRISAETERQAAELNKLKVEDDGFEYVAYLVTYHGKKVIVEDSPSSTDYSVGDMVDFLVVRVDTSKNFPDGKKLLKFMVDDGKKHLKCWIE